MAKKRRPEPPPPRSAECANCGEAFPAGRKACPHCGSDAHTGWKAGDEVDYQSLDIPDAYDEDDYREAIEGLQPDRPRVWTSRQMRIFVVGALLLAAMIVPALIALSRMR